MDKRTSIGILAGLCLALAAPGAASEQRRDLFAQDCGSLERSQETIGTSERWGGPATGSITFADHDFVNNCDFAVRVHWCFSEGKRPHITALDSNLEKDYKRKAIPAERCGYEDNYDDRGWRLSRTRAKSHKWLREEEYLLPGRKEDLATGKDFLFTGTMWRATCKAESPDQRHKRSNRYGYPFALTTESLAAIGEGKHPKHYCLDNAEFILAYNDPNWTPPDAQEARDAELFKPPKPKRRP